MKKEQEALAIPQHVAIIMDGNGRWATAQGKGRSYGHLAGVSALRCTVEAAANLGIQYLTAYTFSSENWSRPQEEVDALMILLSQSVAQYTPEFMEKGVRLHAIGNLARLPKEARESIEQCIRDTACNQRIDLILAVSYSSHWELNEACKQFAQDVLSGKIKQEEIERLEEPLAPYLTTASFPPLDLLIRTGGELRISNFLLYQCAYAELYFSPTLWPEYNEKDLLEAIQSYNKRQRRFGCVSPSTTTESSPSSCEQERTILSDTL